jgi:hypothetical protein
MADQEQDPSMEEVGTAVQLLVQPLAMRCLLSHGLLDVA